jgi:hypothetical protein
LPRPAEKGPLAEVKADVFERRSFAELLASGAIGRLHLSHADVEQRFAGSDGAGVDAEALARPDETFIDLYVAYLNAPTIGRAILGDAGHADLMRREPGQHAWWVASAGRDAFIDDASPAAPCRPPRLQPGRRAGGAARPGHVTPPAGRRPAPQRRAGAARAAHVGHRPGQPGALRADPHPRQGLDAAGHHPAQRRPGLPGPGGLFHPPARAAARLADRLEGPRHRAGGHRRGAALLSVVLARPRWMSVSAAA